MFALRHGDIAAVHPDRPVGFSGRVATEYHPMTGRMRALRRGATITIDSRLSPAKRTAWLNHALAHILVHDPDGICAQGVCDLD